MSLLLDTNVISELGRRDRCHPRVASWALLNLTISQYISVITLGELRNGVELRRLTNVFEATAFERRLVQLSQQYAGSILPITEEIADLWGKLNSPNTLPVADSLIAATALVHGLTLVTRNVKDFARMGVPLVNPFEQ